jgi:SAM-dependent methyltransferase
VRERDARAEFMDHRMIKEGNALTVSEKNKKDWNDYAPKWAQLNHCEAVLRPVLESPEKAFHQTVWGLIQKACPFLEGKRVCVPSSGDNLAVFAFAQLGAQVTSCDIAENQLANAQKVARREGLEGAIEFICTDTMTLAGVPDNSFDLVYTSNGVHVWLNDLPAMYRNICRVLRPGGWNILYDIHPFLRPFDDDLKLIKPYDATGPFESEQTVNFHWRMQDILNALLDAGLRLRQIEELFDEKDYERPFWVSPAKALSGVRLSREEVDKGYDWRENPLMGLPQWLCALSRKE